MHIEQSITIDRPIDVVFTYLSDLEKHPEWVSVVVRTNLTSRGSTGVGTSFQEDCTVLGRSFDVGSEIIAYEPPHLMVQRVSFGSMQGEVRFTLEEAGPGTTLNVVQEGETTGLFKVTDTLVALTMKKQLASDLEMLKAQLETDL